MNDSTTCVSRYSRLLRDSKSRPKIKAWNSLQSNKLRKNGLPLSSYRPPRAPVKKKLIRGEEVR